MIRDEKQKETHTTINDENATSVSNDALYNALFYGKHDSCRSLLRTEHAVRLLGYKYVKPPHWVWRWNRLPVDIVSAIHDLKPHYTDTQGEDGQVSLHYACSFHSDEVVDFILSKSPRSAAIQDNGGTLPLHLAVQNRFRLPFVLQRILTVHPTAVYAVNDDGKTPLDCFISTWWSRSKLHPGLRRLARKDALIHEYQAGSNDADGVIETFLRSFALMMKAHARGTVLEEVSEPPFVLLYEVLRYEIAARIPRRLTTVVLKTTCRADFVRSDPSGNFPLHLACGRTVTQTPGEMTPRDPTRLFVAANDSVQSEKTVRPRLS